MADRYHSPLPSMVMALAGFASFAVGDAIVRSMAGAWPGSAVALLRYSVAALGLAVVLLMREGKAGFAPSSLPIQIGRGAAIAMNGALFWISLSYMPLADSTAIQFTNPVWAAALSAIFLGEAIRGRQIVYMLLAFAGVLVVLQPNVAAFGAGALVPLIAAVGMSSLMVLNRVLGTRGSLIGNQFWLAAVASVVLVPATIAGHFSGIGNLAVTWPSAVTVIKCVVVAMTGTLGHLLLFKATLRASAAAMAPMAYVQILFAVLLGWLLFHSPPTPSMLFGAAIIIGAGWMLIRANMRLAKAIGESGANPN